MTDLKTRQKVMLIILFGLILYSSLQGNRLMLNGSSFLILCYLLISTIAKKERTKIDKYTLIALPLIILFLIISTLLVYKSGNFYF